MGLTATLPPELTCDLEGILRNPEVSKASVDRSNITLTARRSKFGGQIPKAVTDGKSSAGDSESIQPYQ